MKSLPTIGGTFEKLREKKAAAFIPYITAGDPSLRETAELVDLLIEEGADLIELGVPFSDPVADGPVNQRAAERALRHGTSLREVLDFVRGLRQSGKTTPIVLFTYFNPIFKLGYAEFARLAAESGVSGVLVVDLPPAESTDYRRELDARAVDTIFIASPTSDARRIEQVASASRGFVYYVSRTGVTGAQASLSTTLEAELAALRRTVKLPIGVGFGISTADQAARVAAFADGVVVGSALVRLIEENPDFGEAKSKIRKLAHEISHAVHGGRRQ
jgi:tryptophan synthase alpha chain